jgi:hypothetical protein
MLFGIAVFAQCASMFNLPLIRHPRFGLFDLGCQQTRELALERLPDHPAGPLPELG